MSTPQTQPTKAGRRSNKKSRQPELQEAPVPSALGPAFGPQQNASPATGTSTKQHIKQNQRKQSNANQKQGSDSSGKGSNGGYPTKSQATPIKAYAGSNFQQSPAASALPLPSFYSKSLPTVPSLPSEPSTAEKTEALSPIASPTEDSPTKRDATPLDFLFEAARNAKATPRDQSPAARSGNLSIPAGSPASRSPGPKDGDAMFPFELDGGATPGEDGNAFSTPYKARMEAFKAGRSTSAGVKSMDENERRAKTEALKNFLLQSSDLPKSGLQSEIKNPFNARPVHPGQTRHASGPSTPAPMQDYPQYNHSPHGHPSGTFRAPPVSHQTPKRPVSSRLRNVYGAQSEPEYAELSSDNPVSPPVSTARRHVPQQYSPYAQGGYQQIYAPQSQMPNHRAKPSAQQLEDDLRRVLKLDLTSRG